MLGITMMLEMHLVSFSCFSAIGVETIIGLLVIIHHCQNMRKMEGRGRHLNWLSAGSASHLYVVERKLSVRP